MTDDKHQQNLATEIENHRKSGEFNKALEISERALKSAPADLKAYKVRWKLIAEVFPEVEAKKRIPPEIEMLLRTQPETPEVLNTAHWGYKYLPGRAKNVPSGLFDKMLQYPRTKVYLSALLGLAQQSEDACQRWYYYQRVINECTISDGPSSWYLVVYQEMLQLAEADRSLASDDYLDELIDGLLEAHLFMCRETQQTLGWAYTASVEQRLKFNNRLDKALEVLERAEIRLAKEEEQMWLVENNKGSVEKAYKKISRLRAEIYFQQERWGETYDSLVANVPDFLESVWTRYDKSTLDYLYMLGRSAEGIGEWEKARFYYADAHFGSSLLVLSHEKRPPHVESLAGLERVYHQIAQGKNTDTFRAFLKNTEVEYRSREIADLEKIRQKLITNKLNRRAADFRLETLEGEAHTLSAMAGKVVLLDVGASWCGPCNMAIREIKTLYERFNKNDNVVVLGINDGETPQQVQKFLDEHQPPWPILLDPHRQVSKTYQIEAIPFFVFIDKEGNWQYTFNSSYIINGQPLIWMIEALLFE